MNWTVELTNRTEFLKTDFIIMIVKQFIIIINYVDDNNNKEDTNNWLNELDRETNQ